MAIYLDHNAGAPLRPEVRDAITVLLDSAAAIRHRCIMPVRRRAGFWSRRAPRSPRLPVPRPRRPFSPAAGPGQQSVHLRRGALTPRQRRIVSSAIEHSSILAPLARLEAEGFEVLKIAPDRDGRLDPARAVSLLDENTALVTLGLANSEVGTIENLAPLTGPLGGPGGLPYNAAQAIGRIPVDVSQLGCDLMTVSGHKLGAPTGIGALSCANPASLDGLFLGGPQERGLRDGIPTFQAQWDSECGCGNPESNARGIPRMAELAGSCSPV